MNTSAQYLSQTVESSAQSDDYQLSATIVKSANGSDTCNTVQKTEDIASGNTGNGMTSGIFERLLPSVKKSTAALAAAAALMAQFMAAPSAMAEGELSGQQLVVAMSVAPPFVTMKGDFAHPDGLDIQIIKELQRRTGFNTGTQGYEFMSFDQLVQYARSGQSDIAGGGVTYSDARTRFYDITKPYLYNNLCIVTRNNMNISGIKDLQGKSIAVQNGIDPAMITGGQSGITIKHTPTIFMTFYMVDHEQADALIIDEIIARDYLEMWPHGTLKLAAVLPNTESGMALFLKKGSPRNKILMAAYDDMMRDGTIDRIINQYISDRHIDLKYRLGSLRHFGSKLPGTATASNVSQSSNDNSNGASSEHSVQVNMSDLTGISDI